MIRIAYACLLALPALALGSNSAQAQPCLGCGFSYLGFGGACMNFGARIHQHGPLYNYSGGGYGAYGCGGPGCTSPWADRSDRMTRSFGGFGGCGTCHSGWSLGQWSGHWFNRSSCDSCGRGGWGHYAVSTFRNVFHRTHPCASQCGQSCSVGCNTGCSSCGVTTSAAPAPAAPPAAMPAPAKK